MVLGFYTHLKKTSPGLKSKHFNKSGEILAPIHETKTLSIQVPYGLGLVAGFDRRQKDLS